MSAATATKTRPTATTTKRAGKKATAPLTAEEWYDVAMAALIKRAARGKPFTVYDLVRLDGLQDQPHRNGFQALTRRAVAAGYIRRNSIVPSTRPATRGSFVSQWVGISRNKFGTAA